MSTNHPSQSVELHAEAIGRTIHETVTFKRNTDSNDIMVIVCRPNPVTNIAEAVGIVVTAQQLREAAGAVLDGPDAPEDSTGANGGN